MRARREPMAVCLGIVGAGAVGQAVSTSLVAAGFCEHLLITSRTMEQAASMAADLDDMGQALGSPVFPRAATMADLRDCEVVVIAARARFVNTRPTDTRIGGLAANAPIICEMAAALRGCTPAVVMVTNPVDLMSRLFAEVSASPRVVGIGPNLDSARYRLILAQMLGVSPGTVHGSVIGEHGDALVVCASATTVKGRAVCVPVEKVSAALRNRPGQISLGIGRTRSGPAGSVISTLRLLLGVTDGMEELSTAYRGGWLGVPLRFNAGQPVACLPTLNAEEASAFALADAKLRRAYAALTERLQLPSSRPPANFASAEYALHPRM